MSRLQIIAVAITIGLNALDGFDVLSISFASPGIAQGVGHRSRPRSASCCRWSCSAWPSARSCSGGVADKIGRRPTMLGCLVLMAVGMFMATTVEGLYDLSIWRIVTGLGIGGMLAAINAVAAEFSNLKRRHLCVSIMAIGYPIGAVLGGLVVAQLLKTQHWRSVFYFGASARWLFIPLVLLFVPESVHWLARKQPAGRAREDQPHADAHGASHRHRRCRRSRRKCASVRWRISSRPGSSPPRCSWPSAYFFHITTFYFVLKWMPKIVVDMGFAASSAAGVLVWANVGGATGGAVLGLLTLRFGVKGLTIGAMMLSTVMVTIFGRTPPDLQRCRCMCACSGFCTNAAIVGMYAIFAQAFPTHVRAAGTGFGIGVGRGGSVLAPIIAGFLFNAGQPAAHCRDGDGARFAAARPSW